MLIRVKKDNKKAGSKEPKIVRENDNSEKGSAAGYKLKTLWLLILTITILNISIRWLIDESSDKHSDEEDD